MFHGAASLTYRPTWIGDPVGPFWLAHFYCNFIILALMQHDQSRRFDPINKKVLEWFGLRSYGIYLFHKLVQIVIPLLLACYRTDTFSPWLVIAIYTVVLFVVSELSYRILEKPTMAWGYRFQDDSVEHRKEEVVQPQTV